MNETDTTTSTAPGAARANPITSVMTGPGSGPLWAALGAAAFAAAALTAGETDDGPVLCLFRRCTGGYCPSCGMTRAAGQFLRGDLAASWRHHPFVLLAVLQTVVFGVIALFLREGAGSRRDSRRAPPAKITGPATRAPLLRWGAVAGLNIALLVAIWLIRLAAGTIPVPFT